MTSAGGKRECLFTVGRSVTGVVSIEIGVNISQKIKNGIII